MSKTIAKRFYQIFRDGSYTNDKYTGCPITTLNQQTKKQFDAADNVYLLNEKNNEVYIYKSEVYENDTFYPLHTFMSKYLFAEQTFRSRFLKYFEENNN